MAIIETVNEYRFVDEITKYRFSAEGAGVLFDYLSDLHSEHNWEFDPVAIRCEFSELSLEELQNDYFRDMKESDFEDRAEWAEAMVDESLECTYFAVILDNGNVLIADW